MSEIKKYIADNKNRFLDELFAVIRIPSISAEDSHKEDMVACAEALKQALLDAGADNAEVCSTEGNPVVYGQKIVDPAAKTVLVYGHYDVMPVDPVSLWDTDPFEPAIKDNRIYARGANDDKGQAFMQIKAFEYLVSTGTLACNVKFMIEGEEEIGSASLGKWCSDNKDKLAADVILVSDTGLLSWQTPSITCGLRGLCYMEVDVIGPNKDLHSGLFGGAVANPANVLTKLVASLVDDNGRITIPHFYDKVRVLSQGEREEFAKAPFDEKAYKADLDVEELAGEEGCSTLERVGVRPALDVNGIWSGYTGEGSKTVIPSEAHAKISMRLVPDQDHHEIAELFAEHLKNIAPKSVKVEVRALHGGYPYVSPTDLEAYQAAEKAMEKTFGLRPLPYYSGGSIPIISTFEKVLGIKSILMGFGLDCDAIHSPNESYGIDNFERGIETIVEFYGFYSKK